MEMKKEFLFLLSFLFEKEMDDEKKGEKRLTNA
jgi:hypothetical protein